MTAPVWILDTTWDPDDLKQRKQRFPFLTVLRSEREIFDRIRELSNTGKADLGGFYFVHHSDVLKVANLLDGLLRSGDFVLFSGAAAGADERVHSRRKIKQNLNDFLQYWQDGDHGSAKGLLSQAKAVRQIDRIRLWLDRAQHDYINLLAPLDLLAMAYVGGEIDTTAYTQTRDALTARLQGKAQEFLKEQTSNLRGLARVFEEAVTLFEDPQQFKRPVSLPETERLSHYLDAWILHVDDEIDNGWDLVMPLLFGDRYTCETDPAKVVDRIAEFENRGDPFLVLLDLGLKSGDSRVPKAWRGVDLLRAIRAQFPAAPVHAFSARGDMETYRRVFEAGANGYIHKPCRVLSSTDEATLYREFRGQLLASRYDIFRYFLYRAFDVIQRGLETGKDKPPFEDQRDPKWRKRRQNLRLFLEALKNTDLERTPRDRYYSAMAIRHLILALYRPFERSKDEGRPNHPSARLLSAYRNECAHAGGEKTEEQPLHSFDLRDLMLMALLLLEPETLAMTVPEEARHLAEKAHRTLFHDPPTAELRKWLRDVHYEDWGDRPLNPPLAKSLPKYLPIQETASWKIWALTADKILHPTVEEQRIGRLTIAVADSLPLLMPLPVAEAEQAHGAPVPPTPQTGRRIKGMAYFFGGDSANRYINFGSRYSGVKVNGGDPGQRDYFAWYYDKHIRSYPGDFEPELVAFLKSTYGVGSDAEVGGETPAPAGSQRFIGRLSRWLTRRTVPVKAPPASEQKASEFRLSLFRVSPTHGDAAVGDALAELVSGIDQAVRDEQRPGVVYFEQSPSGAGSTTQRLGVRLRLRRSADDTAPFLQINPTVEPPQDQRTPGLALDYEVARRLVETAAAALPWLEPAASSTDFERRGPFSSAEDLGTPVADGRRLQEALSGLPVAVVAGTPAVQPAVTRWETAISKSGAARVVPVAAASALVVIVPKDCPDTILEQVRAHYDGAGTPWKVVNPDPRYKDWNVLMGLASRLGPSHEPIGLVRAADPNTLFLGIDLGHRPGVGSTIAATLVDHQGRLQGWTQGPNQALREHTNAERISEDSMRRLLRALLAEWPAAPPRLVIHRDGRTLEDVDAMREIIESELGVQNVDWLDVDKQRAPLFFIDPDPATGQFVVFKDDNGQEEMWLRTAPGRARRYSRPLCLVPRECSTDIVPLGREVFALSNAPTQDYEMKGKLPITTYFADGFSSTGAKQVSFWGYEQLRRPWP